MTYPFVLGTAQLGSHYGITNSYGCPSEADVEALLGYSVERGVCFFDTAFAYGHSLERIVKFCSQKQNISFNLVNKFSVKDAFDKIYENLVSALEKSRIQRFYGVLIHDASSLGRLQEKQLSDFLGTLKKENIVSKVGVSIYAPKDLDNILDVYPVDLVQCPLNLFDQRFLESGMLTALKKKNIEIHARSLFLQGVLLSDKLPQSLHTLQPVWDQYCQALAGSRSKALHFIMSWVKSLQSIDKWVIGVNKKEELSEILLAYDENNENISYDWSVLNASHHPDIDPRNWSIK